MFGHLGGGGTFEARYRAMPVAFIDKQQAEFGDKVILPPSALDRLGEQRGRGSGGGAREREEQEQEHAVS